MLRTTLLFVLSALTAATCCAQESRKAIYADINRSASNYHAYEPPVKALTPAPKGYKPYYISTYARHGSRFLISGNDYKAPLTTLLRADSAGALTEAGKQVLAIADSLYRMSSGRLGELTPLGARQHQGIARRMYHNFPSVFVPGADINARSTPVVRCILSMMNECFTLKGLSPQLKITTDASYHDMYYMNDERNAVVSNRDTPEAHHSTSKYSSSRPSPDRLMKVLFNDEEYVKKYVKAASLMGQLFDLASNMQSHDVSLNLYKYFTTEECYQLWLRDNYDWYVNYGPSPLTHGRLPYTQANLLRNILNTADTCLQRRMPSATLRFGHEVCVLPLACLLQLNECGYQTTQPDSLEHHWRNYEIFPMASNVQFVFYRSPGQPILVKVLLNEREARLPLPTRMAPYYKWSEVEAFYRKVLDK